jgi:hypothetical protein
MRLDRVHFGAGVPGQLLPDFLRNGPRLPSRY